MESNVVVDGSATITACFNDYFDRFWTNRDGRSYSLDYAAFAGEIAADWKWHLGEHPFYFSSF